MNLWRAQIHHYSLQVKSNHKGHQAKHLLANLKIGLPFKPDAIAAAMVTGNMILRNRGKEQTFRFYNVGMICPENEQTYLKLGKDLTLKPCKTNH